LYRYRVAQAEPGLLRASGGVQIRADGGLSLLQKADLIVVPGWRDHAEPPPKQLVVALQRAHARGAQLLSLCTGAFVLAASALLDRRAATTHWRYLKSFSERFPNVEPRADVLYVDQGSIVTSAGSAAAIDACLHVVRQHHGARIANLVARTMVTPPHRNGNQAQFVITPVVSSSEGGLGQVLDWARTRLGRPLRIADLASRAAMSERTFLRKFVAQVGMTPKAWLCRERVMAAQAMLETTPKQLDAIAQSVGFGSTTTLRDAFRRTIGTSPSGHRAHFRGKTSNTPKRRAQDALTPRRSP
ncbi:MAG: helix-turn-helix domain-containing protein, partial [Burkholderiaceae bacterium]